MGGKRNGTYESVIRGISQQIPEDRREGQHFEQVNFLSDTIEGLVRRRGSVTQDESIFAAYNAAYEQATIEDTSSYKSYDFDVINRRFTLMYRTAAKPANSQAPFAFCIDRDTKKFLPCVFGSNALMTQLQTGGASAITKSLDFIYVAGNTVETNYTQSFPWDNEQNKSKGVVWVRTGNSDQTYTVYLTIKNTATNALTSIVGSYKTLTAQYPGTLDTSDISYDNPEYQKLVNDRTNTYNNAANAWITTAAEDKLPSNIAQKIMEDLIAKTAASAVAGQVTYQRVDGTIGVRSNSGYIIEEISIDDDSDKTSLRPVGNQVEKEENLSALHFPGKVVRIVPENGSNINAKYVIADTSGGDPNVIRDVTRWKETAGVVTTPIDCFAMGYIKDNVFYLAGSKAELMTISGETNPDVVPDFVGSQVGDDITVRPPHFAGRRITYLGEFQDRLVIGCESTLSFSRTGKYLDFFRETMTTISDDDGIEIFSLGADGDIIKSSVYFDKNLIFFGNRKQYFLPGQNVLTPKSATLTMLSSHEDAVDSDPKSSGNLIFYTQYRNGVTSMHQFQQGLVQDSPDSYDCSSQLSNYINGQPIEIKTLTSPNKVVLRLRNNRNKLYFYDYLDERGERLFDSWSSWEWNTQLGSHIGLSYNKGNLGVCSIRHNGSNWFVACDNFVFDTILTDKPVLDGLRPYSSLPANDNTKFISQNSTFTEMSMSYDNNSPRFLMGQSWENKAELLEAYPSENDHLWCGFNCEAYVSPTNPYIRDNKDKAMINGRLTINKFTCSVDNTGGMQVDYVTPYTTQRDVLLSNGMILATNSIAGTQPVIKNRNIGFWINKETRGFQYTIRSRKWLPITIKSIEWTGQFFLNSGRA